MSTTKQCASDELLRNLLELHLSAAEASALDQHLQNCAQCQSRLEQAAGSRDWWSEANSMLADYHLSSHLDAGLEPTENQQRKRLAGIQAYLSSWIGPTDDPTKMGRIGPYEVVGVVGYGGAGVVLRAHDNRLNRPVAIKALLPTLAHNPMARRRFERESRAVAAITHQNVVPIYAVDTYNDHPYIAMYYVGGQSLQQRLDRVGPLQVAEIVRIADQVARALASAHAQGVIHRDVKPANILLESNVDRVFVTDFGLARVADDATTHSGVITGTPQYMSPEQCYGQRVDHRSDLFSLGSVMYAMGTGRPPFRSDTLMGMLRKVCDATPTGIRELNPEIPDWLESFISRLLSKDPAERFDSAGEVAELLERELAHMHSPTTVPIPERRWLRHMVHKPISPAGNLILSDLGEWTGDPANARRFGSRLPSWSSIRVGVSLVLVSATFLAAATLFPFLQGAAEKAHDRPARGNVNGERTSSTKDESGDAAGKPVIEQTGKSQESGPRILSSIESDSEGKRTLHLESPDGAVLEMAPGRKVAPSERQD